VRRPLWKAVVVTALVFAACFMAILGVLVLGSGELPLGGNRVALVEVEGVIADSERVVRELEAHGDDPSIRAVVVRIQSPGGVVAPTQEIYRAIRRLRERQKPVVASMGSVAASGGYYLAAAADHIVANQGSLTGSIGVLIQLAEVEGLLRKVGVRYEIIKAGRYKDIGNISRPMTDEERQILQSLLDDLHEQFVTDVADGRRLERTAVRALADGRVFSGRRARELGLVDSLGGLDEAVQKAAELARIPGKPRLVRPRRPFHLTDLLEWLAGTNPAGGLFPLPRPVAWSLSGSPKLPLYLME
jgi:protease-4